MGMIGRTFKYLDERSFCTLFKALVRSHLEYANQIWAPFEKKHITSIENVQRRATKLISGFHDLEYSERLKRLASLPTLAYRRMRGDMIELYKIMTGKYDSDATPNIPRGPGNQTRGHQHKIFKERIRLNQRKYSFIPRSTDIWNNFPEVVKYAPSVATFEKRLDKFWKDHPQALDHPIKYDCTKSP